MAKYNSMVVTNVGKNIYAKAIAGKTIEFTKAVVGSGKPDSQADAENLSNLVEPELQGAIEIDTTSQPNKAIITVSLSNETLQQPLSIQELGLFCKDPDTNQEVMYAYCFAEDEADVIPAIIDGDMVWRMQLVVYITNATGSNTSQQQGGKLYKYNVGLEYTYSTSSFAYVGFSFYSTNNITVTKDLINTYLSNGTITKYDLNGYGKINTSNCALYVTNVNDNGEITIVMQSINQGSSATFGVDDAVMTWNQKTIE